MEFYLEAFTNHKEQALEAYRQGDFPTARTHFLQAARYLALAAQKSEGKLRASRLDYSKKLLEMANSLKGRERIQARPHAQRHEQAEASGIEHLIVSTDPGVRFKDIAGLEDVKEQIRVRMIYSFTHPQQAAKYGVKRGGGILLYGPPGTGKTMIAQAVAGEVQATFFAVQISDILSKWVGEAEHNINRLFAAARQQRLSVIFIDEIESLAVSRRSSTSSVMPRVVAQILTEMEGFHKGSHPLLFIGATNEPWVIDSAMLRPGRFDEKIYVGLPDLKARLQVLQLYLEHRPLADDVDLQELAELLEGYSGADIRGLCEKVGAAVFKESVQTGYERPITMGDLLSALRDTRPSVNAKELARYDAFRRQG